MSQEPADREAFWSYVLQELVPHVTAILQKRLNVPRERLETTVISAVHRMLEKSKARKVDLTVAPPVLVRWLCKVAQNRWIDKHCRKPDVESLPEDPAAQGRDHRPGPPDEASMSETVERFLARLKGLTDTAPTHLEVFEHMMAGHLPPAIAQRFGCTPVTVYRRQHRIEEILEELTTD